ncbi:MAG: hypothetical protein ABJC62_06235 [Frankiaceae bacterium]
MTADDDSKPRGAGRRKPTGLPGRRADPDEWRALGAELARAGSFPVRSAASFTLGFWSEWRRTDRDADDHAERPGVLDRIAAFTDELNEMLTRDGNPVDSFPVEESDEDGSVVGRARYADSLTLLADCEKALRAAAETIPA